MRLTRPCGDGTPISLTDYRRVQRETPLDRRLCVRKRPEVTARRRLSRYGVQTIGGRLNAIMLVSVPLNSAQPQSRDWELYRGALFISIFVLSCLLIAIGF